MKKEIIDGEEITCWDWGEDGYFDRYTVVYHSNTLFGVHNGKRCLFVCYVGMSEHPYHPQGFGQHEEMPLHLVRHGGGLGKRIMFADLPPDCQKLVRRDIASSKKEETTCSQ